MFYKNCSIAVISSLLFIGMAHANTGTITFNGALTSATCDVDIAGAASPTVTLPTLSINQLTAAAATAGTTGFTMSLSGCTGVDGKSVAAFFELGATVDASTGRLINTASTDAATNVQLQILDTDRTTPVAVGNTTQLSNNKFTNFANGASSLELPYAVRYYATGATTAGNVNSSVVYSLIYK
ncbi:fimbrial protein [Acinetobacter populi]|uniref:Fimbrial protein n=1 Tax=Acinetobacter populi TaxID=1582270 RepID=A0A1Z9Z2J5_9GAMM|nr:fimbrial protein [Acinetobacter populi]OUY08666.1 hypothetical protein CAP51_03380 [Acinetobacter populi]